MNEGINECKGASSLKNDILFHFLKTIKNMQTLLEKINEKIDQFQLNATNSVEKANKAAGARARKASLDIEKMLKEFRKKSMEVQNKI